MDDSIRLSAVQRKALLKACQSRSGEENGRRANVVLLLAKGWSYRMIRDALFASFDFIAGCAARFRQDGVPGLFDRKDQAEDVYPLWLVRIVQWLMTKTPQDFGYFRSRWSCEILAEVLAWETGERLSRETIRRGLRRMEYVWRRPRPVVGPNDPQYAEKLGRVRQMLADLPADETAVFQDEVDIHLNPKIGSCWMVRGEQAEVVTPGNNQKAYLAGSLHWRTGTLLVSEPANHRNASLFVAHLDHLRNRLRGYRVIHVVCDNARFHDCRLVQDYLTKWGHRIQIHFLPKYAPETNPIERIWWRLHETVTRNHRCPTLAALIDEVYGWIGTQTSFYTKTLAEYAQAG
jgi:putative transposase